MTPYNIPMVSQLSIPNKTKRLKHQTIHPQYRMLMQTTTPDHWLKTAMISLELMLNPLQNLLALMANLSHRNYSTIFVGNSCSIDQLLSVPWSLWPVHLDLLPKSWRWRRPHRIRLGAKNRHVDVVSRKRRFHHVKKPGEKTILNHRDFTDFNWK